MALQGSFFDRLWQLDPAREMREVEVVYPDVNGSPRGKIVPVAGLAEEGGGREVRMARAILLQTVNGDYPDGKHTGSADPDMLLLPDLDTLRRAPWAERPRAIVVADCIDLSGGTIGQPSAISSRAALRRVLAAYAERGLTPIVAPELEFYVLAPQRDPAEPYALPPGRSGRAELGQSNFGISGRNELGAFFDQLDDACVTLGLGTDTFLHEMGPSQYEINLRHGEALALADQTFYFKHAVRETAARHGLMAVFMAKPLIGKPGSSMHLHQSLVDAAGNNVFSLPDGGESPLFYQTIAGLQRWLPELIALLAPHVNSYRRFVRDANAPINLAWGYDNRSVGLRVPLALPSARRIENRLAGADANPYLALAASLACGLGGIEAGLQPAPPVDHDVSLVGQHALPERLEDALRRLEDSAFARRLLGDPLIDGFVASKRVELKSFWAELTPWERRYLTVQV